ncbi:MAG: hypothetical protein ACO1SV_09485 [Fimbriimonas sp.]
MAGRSTGQPISTMMRKLQYLIAIAALAIAAGCSDSPSTAAPNVQGKPRPDWKTMSKEEKIEMINKMPIPDDAKRKQIEDIQAGRS